MVNEISRLLIDHGVVQYGDFTLASGAKSTYYIDVKTALTDTVLLKRIGEEIAGEAEFDVVAGVAVGGIALAVSAAMAAGKKYVIIRKEAKGHGREDLIIGGVRGLRTLLVEDVTTSGGSVLYGIRAIRQAGGIIDTVVTVVDREQGASETLAASGIRLISLSTASQILRK